MSDEMCEHDEGDEYEVVEVYAPVEPWTTYDLIGHLVGGVAASVGAWANALAGISNDLFAAGRHKRQHDDYTNMINNTREEIDMLPTFEGDR